ncbi:hypothetical protein J2X69_004945 [Algoriphagus sp. 4150]|nr:hypothetical protein [Algoriphagus sp. 4150]
MKLTKEIALINSFGENNTTPPEFVNKLAPFGLFFFCPSGFET